MGAHFPRCLTDVLEAPKCRLPTLAVLSLVRVTHLGPSTDNSEFQFRHRHAGQSKSSGTFVHLDNKSNRRKSLKSQRLPESFLFVLFRKQKDIYFMLTSLKGSNVYLGGWSYSFPDTVEVEEEGV